MTVIDTSLVFPHYYGMPFRRSLKSIVQSYLKREIQASIYLGRNSYEDARSGNFFFEKPHKINKKHKKWLFSDSLNF